MFEAEYGSLPKGRILSGERGTMAKQRKKGGDGARAYLHKKILESRKQERLKYERKLQVCLGTRRNKR